ncbi:class I SAM-dependent methyltransferase [Candidatus Babeliales bacterium]|nr:class I SAM-dependent methyltransferase [Candidatus Babeliales bacterium]
MKMENHNIENIGCSTVFSWDPKDFDQLLKSCDVDDEVAITLKYLPAKNLKILEAGCGIGRVSKYLDGKGFSNLESIEINPAPVAWLNKTFPALKVVQGDLLSMPYPENSFDVVLSYGVVEHFPQGPDQAMEAMFKILKPGGTLIITVPSYNHVRRVTYWLKKIDPRMWGWLRALCGKKKLVVNGKKLGYYIDPQHGKFFEYRFTKRQFERVCTRAGFQIIESNPIAHVDGLLHCFGAPLVTFKNWEFKMSKLGACLNWLFTKIPFFHNHMQACVLKKPE